MQTSNKRLRHFEKSWQTVQLTQSTQLPVSGVFSCPTRTMPSGNSSPLWGFLRRRPVGCLGFGRQVLQGRSFTFVLLAQAVLHIFRRNALACRRLKYASFGSSHQLQNCLLLSAEKSTFALTARFCGQGQQCCCNRAVLLIIKRNFEINVLQTFDIFWAGNYIILGRFVLSERTIAQKV